MSHQPLATSYDQVPYTSQAFAQTQPDRLATIAHLFGLNAPALSHARVLEIGCAAGGNLLPLAVRYPKAEFIGVDLSSRQIAAAQDLANVAGLRNVRLICASFTDLPPELGEFDYIISHGVFSWVDTATQDAMLALCEQRLAPRGVAYISYNTNPGWRMRGTVRDLMRYHLSAFAQPEPALAIQQARAMLQFAAEQLPQRESAYALLLKEEMANLAALPDYYLFHDHLEHENHPLYFHEFAAQAATHGLQYLAEADLATMFAHNFAPDVAKTLLRIAPDIVRSEQIMDFLRNRTFRQTLLCRQDVTLTRNLQAHVLQGLALASPLRAENPSSALDDSTEVGYSTPNGAQLRTPVPAVKAALQILAQQWPQPLRYDDVLTQSGTRLQRPLQQQEQQAVSDYLLRMLAAGALEMWSSPPAYAMEVSARPKVTPLVREQASRGLPVANQRHENVGLDAVARELLPLLDGEHDHNALAEAVLAAFRSGRLVMNDNGQPVSDEARWLAQAPSVVRTCLESLARAALLIA